MKKYLTLLFIILLVSCGSSELDDSLRLAKRLSDKPDLKSQAKAADAYNYLLKTISESVRNNAFLQKSIGKRLLETESYTLAKKYLETARDLKPLDPEVYLYLGMLYANLGKVDESMLDKSYNNYEKALKLKPDLYEAIYGLAVLDIDRGDFTKAESELKQVLKIKRDFVPALKMLGNIRYNEKDYISAAGLYKTALKNLPPKSKNAVDCMRILGKIYKEAGSRKDAIEQYKSILKIFKFDKESEDALRELENKQ